MTDLQESGWDAGDRASVPESARIEIADVGAPPPNLAVTAARIAGDRIVATIHNTGPAAREARVSLSVHAGRPDAQPAARRARRRFRSAPNQSADVTLPRPARVVGLGERRRPSGAPADNARYVVLDDAARAEVLVVTATGDLAREAFYVAAGARRVGRGRQRRTRLMASAAQRSSRGISSGSMRTPPSCCSRRAGSSITDASCWPSTCRKGGGVLVAAGADIDGEVVAEALGGATMTIVPPAAGGSRSAAACARWRRPTSAIPCSQSFGGPIVARPREVSPRRDDSRGTAARRWRVSRPAKPALVDCDAGTGRALVLASDLDNRWNDFPLHATFVPFVHEAMRYLSGGRPLVGLSGGAVPAGVPPVPGVAPLAPARARRPGSWRSTSIRRSPTAGRLTAEEFQTAVTRLKDAAAGASAVSRRASRKSASTSGSTCWR